MIEGAIHNPSNHDHFMQLDRMGQTVRIVLDGVKIAETGRALRLLELGRRMYQPQYYIPREDVAARLVRRDKITHCPLKGDATYFDVYDETGAVSASELGWSYLHPFDMATEMAGHVAFDPKRVSITVEALVR